MIVGDPSRFAIESSITEFCGSPSQIALGFFVIHVQGQSYGIRDPKATMLGLPLQTVSEFIAQTGTHRFPIGGEPDAILWPNSMLASVYSDRQPELFFGMAADKLGLGRLAGLALLVGMRPSMIAAISFTST